MPKGVSSGTIVSKDHFPCWETDAASEVIVFPSESIISAVIVPPGLPVPEINSTSPGLIVNGKPVIVNLTSSSAILASSPPSLMLIVFSFP